MDWKQFLKPSWKKVIITLFLWLFILPVYGCYESISLVYPPSSPTCSWAPGFAINLPVLLTIGLLPPVTAISFLLETNFLINIIIAYLLSCTILHFWNK
ncbi:MAG: hypothetical protein KJ613_01845, partial [Nanoarchaeota archaeon]|nr:hypothetical protein [Nanoarchaeota archaeon]